MSGICGVFNRHGATCQEGVLQPMIAAAPHRGPDGSATWSDGPVALAHQQLHSLPPARRAPQPLRDEEADLTLVLYGRIDNRVELAAQLGSPRGDAQLPADANLVLLAYRHWGAHCSDRLIGDFAFVIWDGVRRSLFASRDPSGCIPFFYALFDEVFVFGSELCQVLAHPRVSRRVNEGMAGEFLSTGITSKCATLYRDIHRLAPGHHMEVASGTCRISRHWTYLPLQQIIYRDPREYLEHFLELFERAVADRLDCAGTPGISLSGGLDSPAIAGMAQSLLNRRGRGEQLQGFSLTTPQTPAYDEAPYIKMVADKWRLKSSLFPIEPLRFPNWRAQVAVSADLPQFPNDIPNIELRAAARSAGVTTLFTGMGADSPLGGSCYGYYDLLQAGSWSAIVDEFALQRRGSGPRSAVVALLRSLAWPLLPRSLRAWVERHRRFSYRSPFIKETFAKDIGLYQRHRADTAQGRINNLATWNSWWHGNSGVAVWVLEVQEREDALYGLEGAHPFLDRRLREFLFALPSPAQRAGGEGKQLLARSGLLPERVARDRKQGDYSVSIRQALCVPAVQKTLQGLAIAELGWVHQDRVDEAVRIVQNSQGQHIWSGHLPHLYLWMVFSLELWVQTAIMDTEVRQIHG